MVMAIRNPLTECVLFDRFQVDSKIVVSESAFTMAMRSPVPFINTYHVSISRAVEMQIRVISYANYTLMLLRRCAHPSRSLGISKRGIRGTGWSPCQSICGDLGHGTMTISWNSPFHLQQKPNQSVRRRFRLPPHPSLLLPCLTGS